MTDEKVVKFDLDGYEVVKDAILEIINQCPLIVNKERVYVLPFRHCIFFDDYATNDGKTGYRGVYASLVCTQRTF